MLTAKEYGLAPSVAAAELGIPVRGSRRQRRRLALACQELATYDEAVRECMRPAKQRPKDEHGNPIMPSPELQRMSFDIERIYHERVFGFRYEPIVRENGQLFWKVHFPPDEQHPDGYSEEWVAA